MKTFGSATTFHVSNLDASMKHYTKVLGFSEHFQFGDYAGVEYGDIQIHLSGPKAANKKEIGQGSIYIFCDDVDAYYADVSARGARTQAAPKDYDYGMRDFVIEDPDGNLIGIGQETQTGQAKSVCQHQEAAKPPVPLAEITKSCFVIAVPNLQKSSAFYRDVLGFTIRSIPDPGWLFYCCGDCTIMAGECPDAIPPAQLGDHSYFAYLHVKDIDALHESVSRSGAQICKTLRDEPWQMREFGLVTADGHRIMFAAPIIG